MGPENPTPTRVETLDHPAHSHYGKWSCQKSCQCFHLTQYMYLGTYNCFAFYFLANSRSNGVCFDTWNTALNFSQVVNSHPCNERGQLIDISDSDHTENMISYITDTSLLMFLEQFVPIYLIKKKIWFLWNITIYHHVYKICKCSCPELVEGV